MTASVEMPSHRVFGPRLPFGRRKRRVRIEISEGAELRVKGCDAIEKRSHRLDCREFAPTHAVDQ